MFYYRYDWNKYYRWLTSWYSSKKWHIGLYLYPVMNISRVVSEVRLIRYLLVIVFYLLFNKETFQYIVIFLSSYFSCLRSLCFMLPRPHHPSILIVRPPVQAWC
uniref:Uncharacterized protein n=1 Tax=Wolfiporia cocos TaxID=81056 RepID=A0A7G7YDR3_9APHY|nr:hypothetical protein [Wolfiporia cocos]QNH92633.1 hypothetical protein [Wolfiporia cocos]